MTYDITSAKRLPKALKTARKFLNWVQNSVFEGELTTSQVNKLKIEMKKVINKKEDSIIFYEMRTPEVFNRNVLGIEKNEINYFI